MENAAKALEIAGGVLIAVLVLALLVFGFNRMSELKQIEQDVDTESKATDFNKQYETYNRDGLYGSVLFSLANKVEDYNATDPEEEGYSTITLNVTFTEDYSANGTPYFKKNYTYSGRELNQQYDKLEEDIISAGNVKLSGRRADGELVVNKTISGYWKNVTSQELRLIELYDDVSKYLDLVDLQTEVARLIFDRVGNFEYETNTGRIKTMSFKQR